MKDKKIRELIRKERERQRKNINLIASENFISKDVMEALGSVFVNKYAEGYPNRRYYGGNIFSDELELLTQKRALKLFGLGGTEWKVNVQPYSGSPANLAVYSALVPEGEKIMGMQLDMGGHLTHGHKVSFSGKVWQQVPYGVKKGAETIDYQEVEKIAVREKPKIIVAGYTAYSRKINFKKFKKIANKAGALFMVDMSHFAGLVAGEIYPSPFKWADIVTSTTHKTLRGPRSALIFSKNRFSKDIDKAVFPGIQGGPHLNQIAAVAVALKEADSKEFKKYAKQVVDNAILLAQELKNKGWRIVSGGTESHLFMVDTIEKKINGKDAEEKLEKVGIIVNKNAIPYDTRSPFNPSGIRIGTPAITTMGTGENEIKEIAEIIDKTLKETEKENELKKEVKNIVSKFKHPSF